MEAQERIAEFLSLLRDAKWKSLGAQEAEEMTNKETQDILHAIEFNWYNTRNTEELVRKLGMVRRDRRKIKTEGEIARLVTDWAMKNEAAIISLERLQEEIQRVERHREAFSYTYQTDIMTEREPWEADEPPDMEAKADPLDDGCAREETMGSEG